MVNLIRKPSEALSQPPAGKYNKFNLVENPFPPEPAVNKNAPDKRFNGEIYEMAIREKEYNAVVNTFLSKPMNSASHRRMGYLRDASYIGRGNGKSAFLIHLQNEINKDFCDEVSGGANKCAALILSPEAGGRSRSFQSFVDLIFQNMLESELIESCLTILRYEVIADRYPDVAKKLESLDAQQIIDSLKNESWYSDNDINYSAIQAGFDALNDFGQLPSDFPLRKRSGLFDSGIESAADFKQYYLEELKKPQERLRFIQNDLVIMFKAANFTGLYLLVDDFERIPDFQSTRQKRDFAFELRHMLYDGSYLSSRYGFYVIFLVIHAGVQGLIHEAWTTSGLEHRAPIAPVGIHSHIIPFEKLNEKHSRLLLSKYLNEYRLNPSRPSDLRPFDKGAINLVGEKSEFNAAKMLKMAYSLIELAADDEGQDVINKDYVISFLSSDGLIGEDTDASIKDEPSVDLVKKAKGEK